MEKQTGALKRVIQLAFLFILVITVISIGWYQVSAQNPDGTAVGSSGQVQTRPEISPEASARAANRPAAKMRKITLEQRKAAAERRAANEQNRPFGAPTATEEMPEPGGTPKYFGPEPNWAYSPIIRKFVDTLPGVGATNANNLGQYIPIAVKDISTYSGSDYYQIALSDYTQQMHSDLPPTKLRGYKDLQATGADAQNHYLGPLIIAQTNRPVRIKFTNMLDMGTPGNLFIPVDTTVMGAGMGPVDGEMYMQNRATLHLHGGLTPWISDGTPHQWTVPAGETTSYKKGLSTQDVPDMTASGDGEMTFYYPNQQSSRLMFYHDHAYGITRLNVYAGEAAGYLLVDSVEEALIDSGKIPNNGGGVYRYGIPLIIQDKTFVDATTVTQTDPTWAWGSTPATPTTGDIWYPHVYMPNQNPNAEDNVNPFGRWDYGPWFWPPLSPTSGLKHGPITLPDGTIVPGTPDVSMVMEAFMDTPLVNGCAYPILPLERKAYRFRILNACNDRFLNLQLYYVDPAYPTEVKMVPADPNPTFPSYWPIMDGRDGGVPDPTTAGPSMIQIGTEGGFLPKPAVLPNTPIGYDKDPRSITINNVLEHTLFLGPAERADVIVDFSGVPSGSKIILYNDAPAPVPASDKRLDYYTGNPDLTDVGGTASTQPGYGPNIRTIMRFEISGASNPAFDLEALNAAFVASTGTPGAFAASQPKPIVPESAYGLNYNTTYTDTYSKIQNNFLAYVTGVPQSVGGVTVITPGTGYTVAPTVTLVGGGGVSATATATVLDGAVTSIRISNPGTGYTSAPSVVISGTGISASAIAFLGMPMQPKAIHELFELDYGRMNSILGLELPFTDFNIQTTIPLNYIDPVTEILENNGIQIWKITHNGVDTHAIHFHLFNVQIINRVDWAGVIKPPDENELGWKETVRMNPLEDCIVALQAVPPQLPFAIPDSVRPLDPISPVTATIRVTNPVNGNFMNVTNSLTNFGWEYVWHCHLLGHEEMDMMRPIKVISATVTDTLPPGAAAFLSPTGTPGNIAVNIGAVDNVGGSGVASITYSISGTIPGGPFTVPGSLLSIIAYAGVTTVTYFATDNIGNPSAPLAIPIPGVPGAPTAVTAVRGNGQATISFTPPASDGGSPITMYTVTSNPGGISAYGTSSPIIVTGLTNGVSYSFTVAATNTAGTGPASTPSNSVTPATLPGAPTSVSAVPGLGYVTISFIPPASDGGSPITLYTATSNSGNIIATSSSNLIIVPRQANGPAYMFFTVTATNDVGTGPASEASNISPATLPAASSGGSSGGGSSKKCGLLGTEVLALIGILMLLKRRRR